MQISGQVLQVLHLVSGLNGELEELDPKFAFLDYFMPRLEVDRVEKSSSRVNSSRTFSSWPQVELKSSHTRSRVESIRVIFFSSWVEFQVIIISNLQKNKIEKKFCELKYSLFKANSFWVLQWNW